MESREANRTFFGELASEIGQIWRAFLIGLDRAGVGFRNQLRRLRGLEVDYVVIPLSGSLPERSRPPRGFLQRRLPLPAPPLTMEMLNYQLGAVADANNVKGVVFVFQGLVAGLATLQNLRRAIQRVSKAGKHTVVYSPYLDLPHYFVASAADQIVAPPISRFEVLGMRTETIFLRDALSRVGIEADVVQISPFKTGYNELGESDMTPEQEQQLNWLLDDAYDQVTSAMAAGRGLSNSEIKDLIDGAPMPAERAMSSGLIDHIAYEDGLPYWLAENRQEPATSKPAADRQDEPVEEESERARPKARMAAWSAAQSILLEKPRRPSRNYIGVVSLVGRIGMGASRSSPLPIPWFGDAISGESTMSRLLRRAEKDRRLAALILRVDSGGGSALASDLIWRQVRRLAKRIPVVAYMGNIAASGGYYVAAAGGHIMSQPLTLTGSIGVVTLHLSTQGLFEQLSVKRVALKRGEKADLNSGMAPLSEEDRQLLWSEIADIYERFKDIVADSRAIPVDDLDEICGGRLWTGRQALEKKLVDGHGDFADAIEMAAEMAGLPFDDHHYVPVYNLHPSGSQHILPKPLDEPEALLKTLSREQLAQDLNKPLLILPVEITFR
ncbi:MAG: signal peptide peptidase SppA [Chloroflexota bacterium]|nr:MAG: signal peptide peptidase SppA [Chloroflexota bacterium]